MDNLESKIVEILKRGTPLRAVHIADMLGVERREINHYLYSSLKHMVVQDSDYRWSLKTNQISKTQRPSTQAPTSHTKSSQPVRQNNLYSFTKEEIKQDSPLRSTPQTKSSQHAKPTSQTPSSQPSKHENLQKFSEKSFQQNGQPQQASTAQTPPLSQPVKQNNPYKVIKTELGQASPEEKVKIIENAFRQEQFRELEDEEINALQSILEQSRREIDIANTAYTQGKLSTRKNNPIMIAILSVALTLSTLFLISQFIPNLTNQPSPTIPQTKSMQ
ncbi:hypothetical protein [Brasilonema bromeliae]|uniref:Uncharacterized protein n=1 Tax=Brasilonema bromeliae SPC951 TaxID=385972 RepID=A0ABX1P1B9_9CYAN|nr:hypothetical protein [Brasilonema bromeliae]NMG18057.1 hypothetical protein [Brasilonema bromeliae SPC951]